MSDDLRMSAATSGEQLLDALRAYEERCREHATGLPQRESLPDIWAGVLFRVGELSLLAPLEEIGEMLEVPAEVTPVPATRAWVFGIANNRGTLLPIFDLRAFLFGSATRSGSRNRVLVVRRDEFPVGLLVSDVTGIRHFQEQSQAVPIRKELRDVLQPFVLGGFELESEPCPVFSLRRLTQDARFGVVAA